MINPWFKFYGGEYLSDPKIASLSAQEKSCWITLLCLASISSIPGVVEFLTIEVLLTKAGIVFDPYHPEEWNNCISVLKKFEQMHMIETESTGVITITNWKKRQESSMTVAERQAKYRENKKSNEKVTERVTKVTLEEKRREEKRIHTTVASAPVVVIDSENTSTKEKTNLHGFEEIAAMYPKKVDIATASSIWRKLSDKDRAAAASDVSARNSAGSWAEYQFIPLLKSYLSGKRWEDQKQEPVKIKSYGKSRN